MLSDARLEFAQLRQQRVADPVAREGQLLVGRVFAPWLCPRLQIPDNFGAGDRQQRPHDTPSAGRGDHRRNPAQTFGPGSAQHLQQDSLGLIVQGVRSRHGIDVMRRQQFMKNAIAERAGGLLDALTALRSKQGDVPMSGAERHLEHLRQVRHELRIAVRLRATQSVMHVDSGDHEPRLGTSSGHCHQQRHGIRATRHSHGNPFPGAKGLSCPAELWLERCHGTPE